MTEDIKKKNRLFIHEHIVMIAAVLGVVVISVAGVLIVRAYLAAKSSEKDNPFGPMTYTNTQIEEDTDPVITFNGSEVTEQGGKYRVSVNKEAHVLNLAGRDKKPVYVRVAVRYSAYKYITVGTGENEKSIALNVSSDYPVKLAFTVNDNWLKIDSTEDDPIDGYYYYKYVVDPGESTDSLFQTVDGKTVTLIMDKEPPDDVYYQIDISADTVQAVSHDRSDWKPSDYESADAARVWGTLPAGIATITKPTI